MFSSFVSFNWNSILALVEHHIDGGGGRIIFDKILWLAGLSDCSSSHLSKKQWLITIFCLLPQLIMAMLVDPFLISGHFWNWWFYKNSIEHATFTCNFYFQYGINVEWTSTYLYCMINYSYPFPFAFAVVFIKMENVRRERISIKNS